MANEEKKTSNPASALLGLYALSKLPSLMSSGVPAAPVMVSNAAPMSVNIPASFLPSLQSSGATGATGATGASGASGASTAAGGSILPGLGAGAMALGAIASGIQAMRARSKRNAFVDSVFKDLAGQGYDTSKFSGPSLTETPEYQALAQQIMGGDVQGRSLGELASVARINDFQNMKASNPLEYERQTSGATIDPFLVRALFSGPSVTSQGQAWGGVNRRNVVGGARHVPLEYFGLGDQNDQTQSFRVGGGPQFSVANQSLMAANQPPTRNIQYPQLRLFPKPEEDPRNLALGALG